MKRILFLGLIFIGAVCFASNNDIKTFISKIDTSMVSFDYQLIIDGYNVAQTGSVELQGKCYKVKTKNMTVFCNDTLMWLVNFDQKEVIIQDKMDSLDFVSNPFSSLDLLKDTTSYTIANNQIFNGLHCIKISLKQGDALINLYISNNILIGINTESDNGNIIAKIFKFKFCPKQNISCYKFNTKELSNDWIITDLSTYQDKKDVIIP